MSLGKTDMYGIFSHFISDIISSQNSRPPLSANVSICLTPPPLFVSHCQHLPYPPSPLCQPLSAFCKSPPSAANIICEQPLMWKVVLQNCVEELGGEIVWKEWVTNFGDNSVKKKWLPILGWKVRQESCVEKWYGTIELTICWKNWMTNLVNKFNGKFVWTIRCTNWV